ncbi:hypothetical protein PCL_09632 [Purpureocillium lilacinum]|uniref:Uncharacterized protein n=1 Tax=Purpureocillium lilacinum TaxID=33203 RepID=A0A2U3DQE4_PURLI|nr:hypothetical protein PCL_09632 [Purpureocillium lilacinum]
MPTASGFIKSVPGGNKFTACFVIDGIQYHFSGNFNPSVQGFISNEATLDYSTEGQLTTQRDFDGKIGTHDVRFVIANGPTISGRLNMPINPDSRVRKGHMVTGLIGACFLCSFTGRGDRLPVDAEGIYGRYTGGNTSGNLASI